MTSAARRLWPAFETYHAHLYFVPEAAEAPAMAGRPLYGALRSLPWPDAPHLRLWHACTLLREHRGDGHVAALTAAGLDGVEAHVTIAAAGNIPRETLQSNRKWSDDD